MTSPDLAAKPHEQTDRLEVLLAEIVAERIPILRAEQQSRQRVRDIIDSAHQRNRTIINAAKAEAAQRRDFYEGGVK